MWFVLEFRRILTCVGVAVTGVLVMYPFRSSARVQATLTDVHLFFVVYLTTLSVSQTIQRRMRG
jgi:hypothetical protein